MILKQAFLQAATAALPRDALKAQQPEPSLVGLQYFVKTRRWEKPASHYGTSTVSHVAASNPFAQVMYGIPPQSHGNNKGKKAFWEALMTPTTEAIVVDGEVVE